MHIRNLSLPPIESAWDNCGPINVSSVLNEQLTEAIYTATDASGNSAVCTASVTVLRNSLAIVCPEDINLTANSLDCDNTVITYPDAQVFNNSGSVTISTESDIDELFPTGFPARGRVTYIATDESGDTVTCSVDITIVDETKPIISCPQDITLHIRNLSLPPIESAWDNCGPFNVSSVLNEQLTEAIYTATDASGNSAVCTASVTVLRNSLAIVCPEDINLTANSLDCDNTVITYPDAQVFNNSGSVTISTESDIDELFPTGFPARGRVTYIATDESGDSAMCSVDITIVDKTKPTIHCPLNITTDASSEMYAIVHFANPTVFDNCDDELVFSVDKPSGSLFSGLSEVTFHVSDSSNNTAQCSFFVNVIFFDQLELCNSIKNTVLDSADVGFSSSSHSHSDRSQDLSKFSYRNRNRISEAYWRHYFKKISWSMKKACRGLENHQDEQSVDNTQFCVQTNYILKKLSWMAYRYTFSGEQEAAMNDIGLQINDLRNHVGCPTNHRSSSYMFAAACGVLFIGLGGMVYRRRSTRRQKLMDEAASNVQVDGITTD